jgi:hypothetical protein
MIEELNDIKLSVDIVDNKLKKQQTIPNHQRKANETFAFLEKHPLPAEWVKEIKDDRIKRRFEQNMSIEQIAQALDLPKVEVLLALEEMGLIEPVNG